MWKGKIISLVLVAAVVFTACGSKEQKKEEVFLYEPSSESGSVEAKEDAFYETTTVRKETYREEYNETAELEYTDTNEVYISEEDAVLDAVKVKKYDKVKKGDVLAVYHVETSQTKLEKERLLVEQARANYESGLGNLTNMLAQAKKELNQTPSEAEKKIKSLELKKLQKEVEAYKKGEKEVIQQEKAYAKRIRLQKKTNLVAKRSGTVISTGRQFVGENVSSSDMIVEMRSNNKWILKVNDPDSMLRYNMEVSVRLGKNMKDYDTEVKGRVITATDITGVDQTDEEGNNYVYVDIRDEDREKYDFDKGNIYVYAVSFEVKDAYIVAAEAVYKEAVETSNRLFVQVLENGSLHKRYIVSNYSNDKEYLVEQGVSEGQTLAIVEQ